VSLGNRGLFKAASFYGNTGLDLNNAFGGPLTFYDVNDGDAMLQAIDLGRSSASSQAD
jgi:hypothetical protein